METIEIELIRIFVKVVQLGSFTKAAERLKTPKSTVSKALARLESLTGTKLLLRTTRSQSLTEAGRQFYDTCLEPIQILEEAQKSLAGLDTTPSGRVKLTAPEDLGTFVIAPAIGNLCRQHPRLSFELKYTNVIVDLVKDGFDLAVRIGRLEPSQMKVRKLGTIHMICVAAPSYLSQQKKILQPTDLTDHRCLCLDQSSLNQYWNLKKDKKHVRVRIHPQVESNQMTSLLRMAVAGAGVLMAPSYLCREDIQKGRLIHVLDGWTAESLPVSLLSPVSMATTARLKLVADHLEGVMQKELQE